MKRNTKIWLSWLLMLAMLLSLAGCGGTKQAPSEEKDAPLKNDPPKEPAYEIQAYNLMQGIDADSTKDNGKEIDDRFTAAQLTFALELFKRSADARESDADNLLISPLSVMLALSMTANGAVGQTKTEMEQVLGGMTVEELNEYLSAYTAGLPNSEKAKLQIANSIWFRDHERLQVEQDFLQTNADYYGAAAYKAPFDEETVKDVNAWVNEKTNGMIKEVLDRISEYSVMFLINALTFDAEWASKYEKRDIRTGVFTSAEGEKRSVELMYSDERQYLETEKATGFVKPYAGYKYKFAALLPNEGIDIYQYIEALDAAEIMDALGLNEEEPTDPSQWVEMTYVRAALPKFSYDYSIQMADVLKQMGMPTAFNGQLADFSALGHSEWGNISISSVLHKTHITVDGLGTKAGAVTVVEATDGGGDYGDPKIVTLDRPFVYMILDSKTNLPIFIGAVTDIQ